MSRPLNRRAASHAFARGADHIRTECALSFEGDVAFSYAEPIAVRVNGHLFVTDASFSITTSGHVSYVRGAWAVEHYDRALGKTPNLHIVHHGVIRDLARERGHMLGYSPWGSRYSVQRERALRPTAQVVADKLAV